MRGKACLRDECVAICVWLSVCGGVWLSVCGYLCVAMCVWLSAGPGLDYEEEHYHPITVQVTDSAGNTLQQHFNVTVLDLNENPTNLTLEPNNTVSTQQLFGEVPCWLHFTGAQ